MHGIPTNGSDWQCENNDATAFVLTRLAKSPDPATRAFYSVTVRARRGGYAPLALSIVSLLSTALFTFVWADGALDSCFWRCPARADRGPGRVCRGGLHRRGAAEPGDAGAVRDAPRKRRPHLPAPAQEHALEVARRGWGGRGAGGGPLFISMRVDSRWCLGTGHVGPVTADNPRERKSP